MSQETTFRPRPSKFAYDGNDQPLGTVAQGSLFNIETEDCFSGLYVDPSGYTAENRAFTNRYLDGVTGPIYVADARPGMAVAIRIHGMEVTTPGSVVVSRYQSKSPFSWWDEEYRCMSFPIARGVLKFSERISLECRPIIGCIAAAPADERILSVHPGTFGGNMDCSLVGPGCTVMLPVAREGALLYFGDCKALMADGEVAQPPEVGASISASVTASEAPSGFDWPRVLTDTVVACVVSHRSLEEASRLAFRQLLLWFESCSSNTREECAMLMAMVAHVRIAQVSNSLMTAYCEMPRDYFDDEPISF